MAREMAPEPTDYTVLKPRHSGFHATPLELLLEHLGVRRLVLAGFATDACVSFTANDAHVRGYRVVVPSDTVAAATPARSRRALAQLRDVLGATTPKSASLDLRRLARHA